MALTFTRDAYTDNPEDGQGKIDAARDRLYNHCFDRDGGESRRPGAHGSRLAGRLPDRALGVHRHRRRPGCEICPRQDLHLPFPRRQHLARPADLHPLYRHGGGHDPAVLGLRVRLQQRLPGQEHALCRRLDRPWSRLLGEIPPRQALRLPHPSSPMRRVSSWGRLSALPHEVIELGDRSRIAAELARGRPGIAYGLGRSYGDACLNPDGVVWRTAGLDRFIHFDQSSGRLACEAGVVLRDIQRLVLPQGWGLPVLPGTQFVTVGGAIANDVHGKNHHETGTFGDHVKSLRLLRTDGQEIVCGPAERPDWFAATVGGLGLTGLIVEAELQLRRVPGPWLDAETIAYAGLDEFFRLSEESHPAWEHAVSWIDRTSGDAVRGLFMRAKPAAAAHGTRRERQLAMPLVPPVSLVNRLTLRPLNQLYWTMNKRHLGRRI